MLSPLDHMAVRKNRPPAGIECQVAPGPPVSRLAPLDFAAVHEVEQRWIVLGPGLAMPPTSRSEA